jgi:glycosyltransferase involved in cell wall biosynthesis
VKRVSPPVLSVIVPVLNAVATLGQQLEALARQGHDGPWEVVVADNGSTDGSPALAAAWQDKLPALRVIDASGCAGVGATRNAAARVARGDAFAFCDADDVVQPGWVEAHADASRLHDLVAGAIFHFSDKGPVAPFRRRPSTEASVVLDFLPFADSSNLMVARKAFEAVGGFSEDLDRSADVDLSWRLQLAGHALHFEPAAIVAKREKAQLRELWRQEVAWGAADVELYLRFRDHGLPPSSPLTTVRSKVRRVSSQPELAGFENRRRWIAQVAHEWGRAKRSAQLRVLYL